MPAFEDGYQVRPHDGHGTRMRPESVVAKLNSSVHWVGCLVAPIGAAALLIDGLLPADNP